MRGQMRIAVVDDDPDDAALVVRFVDRYYRGDKSRYTISEFPTGEDFLHDYQAAFDLVFLDVEMPGMGGLQTAAKLREIDQQVVLVFTTKMAQYAASGYDVDAIGYLVKPVGYYDLALKMHKAQGLVEARRQITVSLNAETGTEFVSSHDILYVEVRGHAVIYHTSRGALKVWGSLKAAEEQLSRAAFVRISRYCLVNIEHVDAVHGDVVSVGGQSLSLSRSCHKSVLQALARYYEGSAPKGSAR